MVLVESADIDVMLTGGLGRILRVPKSSSLGTYLGPKEASTRFYSDITTPHRTPAIGRVPKTTRELAPYERVKICIDIKVRRPWGKLQKALVWGW